MRTVIRLVWAALAGVRQRLHAVRWLVFGLLLLALGYPDLKRANDIASDRFAGVADTKDWTAAAVWLESAECMRRTGAWLTICRGNTLTPIANYALADDPGHALLLGIGAWALERAMTVLDITRLNNGINFAAMACLAALLWAARSYVASIVFMALGGFAYFVVLFYSTHPAVLGAASFAALLPMGLVLSHFGYLSVSARRIVTVAGLLLLAVAALLREPVGIMGFTIDTGVLAFLAWHDSRRRARLGLLALLVLAFMAWQAPRWVVLARDRAFAIPATEQVQTHGISHNLYLGLGSVENGFGIRWDDRFGMEAAMKADPGVTYVSDRYFRTMWRLYFDRLSENPYEVARIYAVKAGKMFSLRLPDGGWLPVWAECAIAGFILVAGLWFGLWRRLRYGQAPIVLSVSMAFVGFFLLQGILSDISIVYAYPIGVFVVLFVAVRSEAIVRCVPCLVSHMLQKRRG